MCKDLKGVFWLEYRIEVGEMKEVRDMELGVKREIEDQPHHPSLVSFVKECALYLSRVGL